MPRAVCSLSVLSSASQPEASVLVSSLSRSPPQLAPETGPWICLPGLIDSSQWLVPALSNFPIKPDKLRSRVKTRENRLGARVELGREKSVAHGYHGNLD